MSEKENILPILLVNENICKIIAELEPIKKESTNKKQGWKFRSIDQVYNALKPLLAKYQLFIRPVDVDIIKHEKVKAKSGSDGYHNITIYTFRIEAIDGSYVDCKAIGECIDFGDKAIGKSASYAMKNMIFQTFCVATEDQEDPDNFKPEIEHNDLIQNPPQNQPKQNPKPAIFTLDNTSLFQELKSKLIAAGVGSGDCFPIAQILNGKPLNKVTIANAVKQHKFNKQQNEVSDYGSFD